MAKGARRPKPKEITRRRKKKVSILSQEQVQYVDWKDVNLLRRFMSDRAKIRARRVTGNDEQQQRQITRAIKNAREMALLPYTNRVTTQRGSGRAREGGRLVSPVPQPTAPPPGMVTGDPGDPMEEAALEVAEPEAAEPEAAAASEPEVQPEIQPEDPEDAGEVTE